MATDVNTTSDDRIGGYRYIRTIHPGHTSVVMEVVQESTQRRFALKQLLASRRGTRGIPCVLARGTPGHGAEPPELDPGV